MKIVINTPAGNIGRIVANQLLNAQKEIIIISRHPEKVTDLVKRGAQLVEGSIDDPAVLNRAFAGASSLFWITPFAFDQPDYINWARKTCLSAAEAAKKNGINRVVLISSVGAQNETGVGPIACCAGFERAFTEVATQVTSLRAASFMENFLMNVPTIAHGGAIYSPHPTDRKIPMVAARDIASKAVSFLLGEAKEGFSIVGVHGPADISYSQAATIISEGVGRPVKHVEVTVQQAMQGMIGSGVPLFAAELLADMYAGMRAGRMQPAETRNADSTTNTTLLEYSREVLKPAVEAAMRTVLAAC